MEKYLTETVINRANEMLKDDKINSIYQSFKTKDEAENWLVRAAVYTLITPVNERR